MSARILVIEDNAANLDLMLYLLGAFGHTTYAARDGQEGLELAASAHPDLIVCDVHLPKLDGYGVVRQLKQDPALRNTPVIAVTALAMVGDRDRVLQAGFDGYLSKPIDPETFVTRMGQYLMVNRSRPASGRQPPSGSSPRFATNRTVLAVDNVPANLDFARSLLSHFGYRVVTATGGREALDKAHRETPDLILSDICMEDGNGFDFIQWVKADPQLCSVPFIFITSTVVEERYRAKGLAMGATRVLFRPIEPEKLLAEIASCLPTRSGEEDIGKDPDC